MKNLEIKNIIFDLGNVIIGIDPLRTIQAFSVLSGKSVEELKAYYQSSSLLDSYDKGLIGDDAFRNGLRKDLDCPEASDEALNSAWNAILLDIKPERIELIKNLKMEFKLFMLSNTSNLHAMAFHKILEGVSGYKNFEPLFDRVYYSFEMGKRKPNADIYKQVLEENNLSATNTLFIDDMLPNIQAANRLQIQTIHLKSELTELDFFKPYLCA